MCSYLEAWESAFALLCRLQQCGVCGGECALCPAVGLLGGKKGGGVDSGGGFGWPGPCANLPDIKCVEIVPLQEFPKTLSRSFECSNA